MPAAKKSTGKNPGVRSRLLASLSRPPRHARRLLISAGRVRLRPNQKNLNRSRLRRHPFADKRGNWEWISMKWRDRVRAGASRRRM